MSFANNLFKGFIRSAVNQVGRDGGKVISNQVYRGAHSTPVQASTREEYLAQGYHAPKFFSDSFFMYPFILFGCTIIPVIGPGYLLAMGIRYLLARRANFYSIESVPIQKRDRRYKTGAKTVGYTKKRIKVGTVDFEGNERLMMISKGLIYLLFGIGVAYVQFIVWTALKAPSPAK